MVSFSHIVTAWPITMTSTSLVDAAFPCSHCLCCPPISQPPHWCQISPSQLPRSYPKSSTLYLQPLLRFIISFPLSYGEHRYCSASHTTNGLQQLVAYSGNHGPVWPHFSCSRLSWLVVRQSWHELIPSSLSLHLFMTMDYLHSIYFYICTIPHQCQPNTIHLQWLALSKLLASLLVAKLPINNLLPSHWLARLLYVFSIVSSLHYLIRISGCHWWCEEASSFQARNCCSPWSLSLPEVNWVPDLQAPQWLVCEIAQDSKVRLLPASSHLLFNDLTITDWSPLPIICCYGAPGSCQGIPLLPIWRHQLGCHPY